MTDAKENSSAAGAAPFDKALAAALQRLPLPWSSTGNSWQHTTLNAANEAPVVCFDLEDWAVTEDNQDQLEGEQAALVAFVLRALNSHHDMRDVLAEILDYRGGADSALEDEYVMERARDALAKAGA